MSWVALARLFLKHGLIPTIVGGTYKKLHLFTRVPRTAELILKDNTLTIHMSRKELLFSVAAASA